MSDEGFERLLQALDGLSVAQLAVLDASIRSRLIGAASAAPSADDGAGSEVDPGEGCASLADIEARFAAELRCPHCRAQAIGRWGTANGLRRYRCKDCKATFNALTGTPLAHLHKRALWIGHAQALADGISLRKVAARLRIDLTTAFRWRHRFLKAPKERKAKVLEGTVEADETYFLRSQKGARKLDRPARKRGGTASKRGLSAEQIPVLIARDRAAATTDEILRDRSQASISAVLEPILAKSAILVSDGAKAYRAFADRVGIAHVGLDISAGQHLSGIYHIQNVNGYASRLKTWMRRFNGVATKYLDSYLGWHRANDRQGGRLTAPFMFAAAWR